MQKSDFKKGQEVFILIIEGSNEHRSLRNQALENRILRATVTTVGRKYITVEYRNWPPILFDIEDDFRQLSDYSADYMLFLTEQDIYDYEERRTLFREIHNAFDCFSSEKYSLEQLRKIKEILEGKS